MYTCSFNLLRFVYSYIYGKFLIHSLFAFGLNFRFAFLEKRNFVGHYSVQLLFSGILAPQLLLNVLEIKFGEESGRRHLEKRVGEETFAPLRCSKYFTPDTFLDLFILYSGKYFQKDFSVSFKETVSRDFWQFFCITLCVQVCMVRIGVASPSSVSITKQTCIGTQSTIWLFDIPKITPPHFWKEIEKSIMFFFFSQKCITQPWVLTAQNMPSPSLFYFKGNI